MTRPEIARTTAAAIAVTGPNTIKVTNELVAITTTLRAKAGLLMAGRKWSLVEGINLGTAICTMTINTITANIAM